MDVRDVKVFGGYVLHSGLIAADAAALKVGDSVKCEVDYDIKRQVVPNHTMTHALNWALREVLGEGVDQRGSLCSADRLRFDFSADGVNPKQLAKVETLVQDLVKSAVPVSVMEAPLKKALEISGVRAIPGESYPDPV